MFRLYIKNCNVDKNGSVAKTRACVGVSEKIVIKNAR